MLLDPYDLTISTAADANSSGFTAAGSGANINITTLASALTGANVTVATSSSRTENGDITLANPLSWSAHTTLTLNAAGPIHLNAGVTNSGTGSRLVLNARGSDGISGSGALASSRVLSLGVLQSAATGTLSGVISGSGSVSKTGTGTLRFSAVNSYSGATTFSAGTLMRGRWAAAIMPAP